jgi:hypothetical protein
MTMFSMKPKFDLAEFLAAPAPRNASGFRGGRRGGMQVRLAPKSNDRTEPTQSGDAGSNDRPE